MSYSNTEIADAKRILEQAGYTVEKHKPKADDEVNVRISGRSVEAGSHYFATLAGTVVDLDIGAPDGSEVYVELNDPSRTGVWVALADVDPLEGGSYGV